MFGVDREFCMVFITTEIDSCCFDSWSCVSVDLARLPMGRFRGGLPSKFEESAVACRRLEPIC